MSLGRTDDTIYENRETHHNVCDVINKSRRM
jgi:hypothetical protein